LEMARTTPPDLGINALLLRGVPDATKPELLVTFGAILSLMLGIQILTGIILAMHYTPEATMAFRSVESIVRDVNYGWLLRNMHASGASMFFFAVYIHMFRGLYYGSYKEPREV